MFIQQAVDVYLLSWITGKYTHGEDVYENSDEHQTFFSSENFAFKLIFMETIRYNMFRSSNVLQIDLPGRKTQTNS